MSEDQPARPVCPVPDCTRPIRAKGMCHMHYQRHQRHGGTDRKPTGGSKPGHGDEAMRRRYSDLDACPRCNALPGNPCREAAGPGAPIRPKGKPHPMRPTKATIAPLSQEGTCK